MVVVVVVVVVVLVVVVVVVVGGNVVVVVVGTVVVVVGGSVVDVVVVADRSLADGVVAVALVAVCWVEDAVAGLGLRRLTAGSAVFFSTAMGAGRGTMRRLRLSTGVFRGLV